MRFYSVGVAALAIDAPRKWVDNLLSQHVISDVAHRQRGVGRGVTWSALVRIAAIWELHERLGCGVREAVALAEPLLSSQSGRPLSVGALSILLDRESLERDLHARLKDALESAPRPRRGRPPLKGSRAKRTRGGAAAET
jgi:hypothetical protein